MKKTALDLIVSLLGVLIFSPILIIIAFVIKKESRGPILFSQKRPGINNKLFNIYKFRSMVVDTPNVETAKLVDQSIYITKSGRLLRKTSLDELPQLFNVIKGDMSIVGPRPALYNQYELIEKRTKLGIHNIKPGITGLAQVMGRDDNTDEEKVAYDKYYLDNQTTKLDIWIMYKTVHNVLSARGIKH